MTPKQLAALKALSASRFHTAHALGVAAATLTSLAERKLVDRSLLVSSVRGGDVWLYRLSGRGCIALNKARRSALAADTLVGSEACS